MLLYHTLKNQLTGCFAQVRRNSYGEYVVRFFQPGMFKPKCYEPATSYESDLASACSTANAMVFNCVII